MYGHYNETTRQYEHRRDFTYRGCYAKTHPWSSTTGRPEPTAEWQVRVYTELMGHEPPDAQYEQFDYNPRTKAGKALLASLMGEEGVS